MLQHWQIRQAILGSMDYHPLYGETIARAVPTVFMMPAMDAAELVLQYAGALPQDAMNLRVAREARERAGGLGQFDDPLTTEGPQARLDSDQDGMPDEWEGEHGLDTTRDDSAGDDDGDGYSNVEEYVNELAAALLAK